MKKYILIPILITILNTIIHITTGFTLISISLDSSFHFNLVTINSIFAGFLFTNYSILLSMADHQVIQELKTTTLIKKRNEHIITGITLAVISIISGILLAFDINILSNKLNNIITCILINTEIIFMLFCIGLFLYSIKEMQMIVKLLEKVARKNILTDDQLQRIKEQLANPSLEFKDVD